MTEQPPYWAISAYDMSPLAEQRRVVKLLERDPPAVVTVDRRELSFDLVPNVLRVPLPYRWVIDHYRRARSVGPYDLLVPRGAGDPADWNEWRGALGETLDLGRLPAAANSHRRACPSDQAPGRCVAYLSIDVWPVTEPTSRVLEVTGDAGTFTVSLRQLPGDRQLSVPLGRLWFWTARSTVSFAADNWVRASKLVSVADGDFLY
jgi:hypothetical protein